MTISISGARPVRRLAASLAGIGLLVASAAVPVTAAADDDPTPASGVPGTPFSDGGSWIYHYVSQPEPFEFAGQVWDYDPTPFSKITQRLAEGYYTDRGITNLMIYAPYHSTGEWRGLPAIDFFDVSPDNGTVEDFHEMVATANARGITVTMYIALIYVDPQNPLWIKAQEDRRDGLDSNERRMFRWDEREPEGSIPPSEGGRPPTNAQVPRPSVGNWAYSEIANRWYATSWGYPALDFDSEVTREYAKDVIRFWMDLGVQGFEYDAPQSYWGMQGANESRQTEVMITTPRQHRPDLELYLHAEGIGTFSNQAYNDRVGFTHVLINGDDDFNSFASRIGRYPQTFTPDQLEDHWQAFFDNRRLNGRGVYAWALYDYDVDPDLRALDVAVQAGMGAQYSIDNEHLVDNPKNTVLPDATLEKYFAVHRALRNSPALSPSASRERVPTHSDTRAYAIKRHSTEGEHTALNVYNYKDHEACVTVNLAHSGISVPQRTVDISTGEPGPWIRSEEATFRLDRYGYLFLDVEAERFPWTLVDDADPDWTYGGGWQAYGDPEAYRGTATGGSSNGASGEITFTGRSVQGWGWRGPDGGVFEVFVDGESHGTFSQQRGQDRFGQRLFSISGLSDGEHVLRIEKRSGDWTMIDYIRFSTEDYQEAQPLPGGDRCAGDVNAPATTVQLAPEPVDGYYDNPSVTLDATDDSSGVATIEYRLDGGEWTEYIEPFQVSGDGNHSIEYRSTDVAGNTEESSAVEFVVRAAVECTRVIDGQHTGPLHVATGVTCLEPGATITGPVSVLAGAKLYADGTRFHGPVSAQSAAVVRLCGSTVTGPVTLTDGEAVTLGDPEIGCDSNQITGPVRITGTDGPTVVAGNRVTGPLVCSDNDPAPVNRGVANSVTGPRSGQCHNL